MIKEILKLFRLKQWIKNLFVITPLVFSVNFMEPSLILKTIFAFAAFCFGSSFVYIINDIVDRKKDKYHPLKKTRPIASGKISVSLAIIIGFIMLVIAVTLSLLTNLNTFFVLSGYIVLNILYSFFLKHEVILDVMIIAIGFVLRIFAGAVAIDVAMSNWIILTTLFISMFFGFGKRRHELLFVENSHGHRPVLEKYNVQLLDYMIVASVTLTVITYSLYTIDPNISAKFGTDKLVYTVPLVIFGLFRYMFQLYKKEGGGDPGDLVLKDKYIIADVILWFIGVVFILYFKI